MKRVILFGGSFDPIHYGHLEVAKRALKQRQADELWFLVAKRSPFKDDPAPFEDRYKMAQLMTGYHRKIKVLDIENRLPEPSYSINTLRYLKKKHPDFKFEWLIGSDHLEDFDRWKDYEAFIKETEILIYPRPGFIQDHDFIMITGALKDISATAIRQGESTATAPSVLNYMTSQSLYLKNILRNKLRKKRYEHVLRVCSLALELEDHKDVRLAALAHDMTKELDSVKQREAMRKTGYPLDQDPELYHGYTASSLLSKEYYLRNKEVLKAIRGHVTGASTTRLGKILYVADKCERGRSYDSEALIERAKKNLDEGFKQVKKEQLLYLNKGAEHE